MRFVERTRTNSWYGGGRGRAIGQVGRQVDRAEEHPVAVRRDRDGGADVGTRIAQRRVGVARGAYAAGPTPPSRAEDQLVAAGLQVADVDVDIAVGVEQTSCAPVENTT